MNSGQFKMKLFQDKMQFSPMYIFQEKLYLIWQTRDMLDYDWLKLISEVSKRTEKFISQA